MTSRCFTRKLENTLTTVIATMVTALVLVSLSQAQTFTVLHNFFGASDAAGGYNGLVRDAAGNLYGTTPDGGTSGYGAVFKIDTNNNESVLHSFAGGTDGCYPWASLILDAAGNIYGTTSNCGPLGSGTVFKVDTSGNETVLHSFAGGTIDGAFPFGGLILDAAGNLYGTTELAGPSGYGVVFRLSPSGVESVLHSFAGGPADGSYPYLTGLLMDAKGNLYGVTQSGGASGHGVVYRLSPHGRYKVLHTFVGGPSDGCNPEGTLVSDTAGNLYGTALECGSIGWGIVWRLGPKGGYRVLHNFTAGATDGANPNAGVVMDTKGNLYGDTGTGGAYNSGTVFELNRQGFTLLHSFNGTTDGQFAEGAVVLDALGNLYGTTVSGGSYTTGTVWELTP